jgi:hypothetical protein
MNKTQVICLNRTPEKWMKLMLHLQNAIPGVFQLVFPDEKAASGAAKCMVELVNRRPTWFKMLVIKRGCTVCVIKTQYVQKVVIKDE